MKTRLIVFGLICGILFQCSYFLKSEPNYIEIKDELGRLKERYGNENSWDNDADFHTFYYYNDKGQLIKERYFSTDSTFIVKDTTDYLDILYTYDKNGDIEKEIKIMADYDDNGNIVGRDTTYITDLKSNTTVYPTKRIEDR